MTMRYKPEERGKKRKRKKIPSCIKVSWVPDHVDTVKLTRLIGSWVWALKLACLWASFLWQKGNRNLSILALSELAHECLCWGNLGFILIQLYELVGSCGKQHWHTGWTIPSSGCGVDAFEPTETKASALRAAAASVTWAKKHPLSSVQGFSNAMTLEVKAA